jgi:hypothetical protein
MAYCKHCQCGHTLVYENMGGSPLRCPKCNRFIAALKEEIYQEQSEEQAAETPQEEQPPETPASAPAAPASRFLITLESPDGELVIPVTQEITVGRNATGKEFLGQFGDVTREHFSIAPRSNGITATLTDHSRWGTYINGVRMIKESSVVVSNYSEIRLASRAVLLVRVKEVNANA